MRMTDLSVLTVTSTVLLTGMKEKINVLFVTEIIVHAQQPNTCRVRFSDGPVHLTSVWSSDLFFYVKKTLVVNELVIHCEVTKSTVVRHHDS